MMSNSQLNVRRSHPRLDREVAPTGSIHATQYLTGTPESVLWGEVLLRAIDDFKTYTSHRQDPEANPVSAKTLRSILADGCDPEYWFFGVNTGLDAVCMVLNIEPDVIRRHLRAWIDEIGDELRY
jgi:hypothetical protein